MFDGLNKIYGNARQNAIHLLTALSQKEKLEKLIITSLWDNYMELQQLDHKQLFKIKKFTQKEQAQYLSTYWSVQLDEDVINPLIKQIATTLNDERGAFLGIPLHCKILAEWVETKTDLEISQLLTITSKFDIIGFYKHFIEQKAPNDKSLNRLLSESKSASYDHYYNLSIDTVLANENENIKKLLRISHGGVSPSKKEEREKFAVKCGLEFGLTYITRTNTVKFLHKSLAEFVLAQYLHLGFHLEDKEQAELLEKQPIRDLIVKNILNAREKYKTVRMFLNFMLEDVVWKREWRNIIIQNGTNASGAENNQSNSNSIAIKRLQQFVKAFRRTRENE